MARPEETNSVRGRKLAAHCLSLAGILSCAILASAIAAPFTEHLRLEWSRHLYTVPGFFCHQVPLRSIWLFGSNVALCSHCTGLFLGFTLAAGAWSTRAGKKTCGSFSKKAWIWALIVMVAVLVSEVAIQELHAENLHHHGIRLFTGLAAGFGIFGFLGKYTHERVLAPGKLSH